MGIIEVGFANMHKGIKVGQMAQAIHTSIIRVSEEFVECVMQHTREAKTRMQGTTCRRRRRCQSVGECEKCDRGQRRQNWDWFVYEKGKEKRCASHYD